MPIPTQEETIAKLAAVAKADGDEWRVKVSRKRTPSAMPEVLLVLDGATVEHFATPEAWLPRIAGGGLFMITAYHSKDLNVSVGAGLTVQVNGDARDVDLTPLKQPGWPGPRIVVFPSLGDKREDGPSYSIPFRGPGDVAASRTLPGAGPPGTGFSPEALLHQLSAERERSLALERRMAEDKHSAELDRLREESRRALQDLEARISRQQPAPAPERDPLATLTPIIAALAPIVQGIITSNQETRTLIMKQDQERNAAQLKLMESLLARKTEDTPITKMMGSIADSMSSVMEMQQAAFQRVIETTQGEKEPVGMKIVGEVTKGLAALAAASQGGGLNPRPALPRPRPAHLQPVAPQSQPQPEQAPQPASVDEALPVVAKFIAMIREKVDPTTVAQDFITTAKQDKQLQDALAEVGDNPINLFEPHLREWLIEDQANVVYVQQVVIALHQLVTPPQEDEGAESEEEDDAVA